MPIIEYRGGVRVEPAQQRWIKRPPISPDHVEFRTPYGDRLKLTRLVTSEEGDSVIVYRLYPGGARTPEVVYSARELGSLLQDEGLPRFRHARTVGNRLRVR